MISEWHGLLPYQDGLDLQKKYWEKTREDGVTRIIGCEHPTIVTLGKRSQLANDLINPAIAYVKIDRGGRATLHSPGQLVIYPIYNLKSNKVGVRDFVEHLMFVSEKALAEYGITAKQKVGFPGLFTEKGKIVFCGLRIDHGVSRHGISINLSNDLNLFSHIQSCGVAEAKLDSVALNLQNSISSESLFGTWGRVFNVLTTTELD